jgi:hypothetical protein
VASLGQSVVVVVVVVVDVGEVDQQLFGSLLQLIYFWPLPKLPRLAGFNGPVQDC